MREAAPSLMLIGVLIAACAAPASAAPDETEPPAEQEKIELPLVFNFLKGTGRDSARVQALRDAMIKRANEILKPAGITVTNGGTHENVRGPGNQDEDAEITNEELPRLAEEGAKEVMGKKPDGTNKTGVKVTICKALNLTEERKERRGEERGEDDGERKERGEGKEVEKSVGIAAVGWTPWLAVAKNSGTPPHVEGETLAHELGHVLGGLADLYDAEDAQRLMYGYSKPNSSYTLTRDEITKIREGAKKFGGRVIKPAPNDPQAPKSEKPRAGGSDVNTQSAEAPPHPLNPLMVPGSFNAYVDLPDDLLPGPLFLPVLPFNGSLRDLRSEVPPSPEMPLFLHLAIDADDDPTTGMQSGAMQGAEHVVTAQITPDRPSAPALGVSFTPDGGAGPVIPWPPVELRAPRLFLHQILNPEEGEIAPTLLFSDQIAFSGVIHPAAIDLPFSAPQARLIIGTSIFEDPSAPFVEGTFFEVTFTINFQAALPRITASTGAAAPGESVTIHGDNMPPDEPVTLTINDTAAATVLPNADGFFEIDLFLDPELFGADGRGFDFIKAHTTAETIATTWLVALHEPCALPGDLNGDCIVNGADLGLLLGAWGPCAGCAADLDGNGVVDGADLGLLLGGWS